MAMTSFIIYKLKTRKQRGQHFLSQLFSMLTSHTSKELFSLDILCVFDISGRIPFSPLTNLKPSLTS